MIRKLSEDKRERLMNAALDLFAANGVQNTSTAAITREAGVAAGTLFLYFPSKQDLVHELVLDISRTHSDFVKALLQPEMSAMETFQTIWDGSIRWLMENDTAFQYIQQVRDSGMIAESVVAETAKHLNYYFEAIQKGNEEHSIKPYPYDLIGNMLYHAMVAVIGIVRQVENPQQQDLIRMGFNIFWDGIKAVPEGTGEA